MRIGRIVAPIALLGAVCAARCDDVLVVCPEGLREAMAPWVSLRESEGHQVDFVPPGWLPPQVAAPPQARRVLMLIGDGQAIGEPPGHTPAQVIRRYAPEHSIVTDQTLRERFGADVVARLPFNDAQTLSWYLTRVVEREFEPVGWGEVRVQIAAGVGGFSPMIDAAIEGSARRLLEGLAPQDADVSLRRGEAIWRDPSDATRGGVWVWMGHGLRDRLPGVPRSRVGKITRGADVAVLVACYAGDFTAGTPCVAEQMLLSDAGPLAVIASTRVSMPYGNARLAGELLLGLGREQGQAIGVLLAGSRRRALPESNSPLLASLDPTARLLGAEPELLEQERREHALMYTLLGDPLLSVRRTSPHVFSSVGAAKSGAELVIEGWAQAPGLLRAELNRDRFAIAGKPRRSVSRQWRINAPGSYRVAVEAPEGWRPGKATLRVGLQTENGLALGATGVRIERPPTEVAARPAVVR